MPGLAFDEQFLEGFDKYGATGVSGLTTLLIMGDWTSISSSQGGITFSIVAPLSGDGSGQAIQMNLPADPSARSGALNKTLGGTYARVSGGVTFKWVSVTTAQPYGIIYTDGGTGQFAITINPTGTISLRRGDDDGTIIATSAESPGIGTTNCVEWDIVCHGSTATATIYLNGLPCTNIDGLTGLDTTTTANNQFNGLSIRCDHGGTAGGSTAIQFDHFYSNFYIDPANPDAGCMLTNPVIDTDFASLDALFEFIPGQGVIGDATRYGTTVATPAAGSLILRKFTAVGDGTLESMRLIPNATNVSAKFKGVIYPDNGSGTAPAPLAPLDVGAEVVGCTSGVALLSDMGSIALTDGTTYWIGFIMDTAVSLQCGDSSALGYRAANTYASGAPNPPPALTSGQGSWLLQGLVAPVEGWSQLRQNPPSSLSYNSSTLVGSKSRHGFNGLTVSPAKIHSTAYKANLRRTDAGARTVRIIAESNGTEVTGDIVAPATSGTWVSGYFPVDPDTGLEWNPANLQASHGGVEIVT